MEDWSDLLPEIIHMISLKIDNPFDLIHFRSVCSGWRRSSVLKYRPVPSLSCPLPLDSGGCGDDCHILTRRVYLFKSRSNQFWLFKLNEKKNGEIHTQSLFRIIMSSNFYPNLSLDLINCQVIEVAQEHVANYTYWSDLFDEGYPANLTGARTAFMRLGKDDYMILSKLSFPGFGMYRSFEKCWTAIDVGLVASVQALTCFKGKFFAIDNVGVTYVVKPSLEVITFQQSRSCDKTRKRWLINSGDKLLSAEICSESWRDLVMPKIHDKKVWIEISELDEERNDWIQVKDLKGQVLFLYQDCSFSCLTTQIPGIKDNSIIVESIGAFYTDDYDKIMVFEIGEKGFKFLKDFTGYNNVVHW